MWLKIETEINIPGTHFSALYRARLPLAWLRQVGRAHRTEQHCYKLEDSGKGPACVSTVSSLSYWRLRIHTFIPMLVFHIDLNASRLLVTVTQREKMKGKFRSKSRLAQLSLNVIITILATYNITLKMKHKNSLIHQKRAKAYPAHTQAFFLNNG